MYTLQDIKKKTIVGGETVICQDSDGIAYGTIVKFSEASVIIDITHPYPSKRIINKKLTHKKIYIINGNN